jgi:prepilin-type N-terminal cleavage/methylation domain-containing protein
LKRQAFTLIELVLSIVVIGILAGVAIPKFSHLKDNAKITAELSTASSVQSALESCHGEWVVNEGNFTCGYDIPSSELNDKGWPPSDKLGQSADKPLNRLLKNADAIGWTRDASNDDRFYGPASDPQNGTDYCLDDRPCKGRYWEYSDENGTFRLVIP